MDKAIDQGFLEEAYDLLWDHYGKKNYAKGKKYYQRKDCQDFKKDCSNLWMAVQPTDGQLFLEGIKKHLVDHSSSGIGNIGDWMPSAANLAKHISTATKERSALRTLENDRRISSLKVPIEEAKASIVQITDPLLRAAFKKDFIECIPNNASRCPTCGDTGRVPFYFYPEKKSHIFLQKEWFDLCDKSPDKAAMFQISTAVCDECDIGTELYDSFSDNSKAHVPPSYWNIKRLAGRRKEKGKELSRKKQEAMAQRKDLF